MATGFASEPPSTIDARRRPARGKIAIITHRKSSIEEAVLIAQAFGRDGRLKAPVVTHLDHVAAVVRGRDQTIEVLRLDGTVYPEITACAQASATTAAASRRSILTQVIGALRKTVLGETIWALRQAWYFRAAARTLLAGQPIAGIISFDDRAFAPDAHILDVAQAADVPGFMATYASSTVESSIWLRQGQREFDLTVPARRFWKRLAAFLLPSGVIEHGGRRLLFHRTETTLALALSPTRIPRPWVYGGNKVQRIFVFGEQDRADRLADGVPAERIVVAGQPSLDILYEAARDRVAVKTRLCAAYGLDADAPIAVLAIPPMAEHGTLPWNEHLAHTQHVAGKIVLAGFQLLVSLHPRSIPATYAPIVTAAGGRIVDEKLSTMLPMADLFVSGYSSTVRWAVMLGIATIVYDFKLAWRMFDGIDGLVIVTDEAGFDRAIDEMAEPELRASRARLLMQGGSAIARLDGHAAGCIVATICSLCGGVDSEVREDEIAPSASACAARTQQGPST